MFFRILGGLDLRRGDVEVRSVLAQPKRVALLAYLALEGAGDYLQRDALLPVFWPEADEERARSSLRTALYNLRSSLGESHILTRGPAEVGLSPDVHCDGIAFLQAIRERRWDDALNLYAGPVLPGFQPGTGSEFEQWLEGRRRYFADAAFGAAIAAADDAEVAKDYAEAVRYLERAGTIRPTDEQILRRQLELLALTGQRGRALVVFEDWQQNLRVAFDLAASSETLDLVEQLRAPAKRVPSDRQPIAEVRETGASVAAQRASNSRRWQVWAPLAIAATILVALAPVLRPGQRTAGDPPALVSQPFEFQGDDAHAYLADVVPLLLRRQLAPQLHSLSGSVALDGNEVRINAAVRTARKTFKAAKSGDVANLYAVIDEVTATLTSDADAGTQPRAPKLTDAIGALRPFARAEAERKAGRFAAAAAGYREALALDSTFALAYYRLSTTQEWQSEMDEARVTADRALAMSHRLSILEQRQLDAWRAYLWGEIPAARSSYDALVLEIADDPELWSRLGELRFHWGSLLGIPRADADTAFRRVIALQPDNAGALFHHLRFVALEGDVTQARGLANAILASDPDDLERLEVTALLAVLERDAARLAALAPQIARLTSGIEAHVLATLATSAPEPLVVRALIGKLPAAGGEPDRRVQRRIIRAQLAASAGQFRAAFADLDTLARAFPERALEYRAFLMLAHPAGMPAAAARALRDSLANLPAPARPIGARVEYAAERAIYPPRRIMLDALLMRAAGLPLDTAALIGRLNRHGDLFAYRYVADIRILANPSVQSRLAALNYVLPEPDQVFPDRLSYIEAWRRWNRANVLLEIGRPEAATWFATFPDPGGYDLPYLPMSYLLRAETLERAGRGAEARASYRRALDLWRDADVEITPFVHRARTGIDRLTR